WQGDKVTGAGSAKPQAADVTSSGSMPSGPVTLSPCHLVTLSRVAIVSFRYGADFPGGAEASLRTIAAALSTAGCAIEIFTTSTRGESAWADELPEGTSAVGGVPVHRFRLDAHDRPRHLEAVRAVWQAGGHAAPEAEQEYLRHSVHSTRLLDALRR